MCIAHLASLVVFVMHRACSCRRNLVTQADRGHMGSPFVTVQVVFATPSGVM